MDVQNITCCVQGLHIGAAQAPAESNRGCVALAPLAGALICHLARLRSEPRAARGCCSGALQYIVRHRGMPSLNKRLRIPAAMKAHLRLPMDSNLSYKLGRIGVVLIPCFVPHLRALNTIFIFFRAERRC